MASRRWRLCSPPVAKRYSSADLVFTKGAVMAEACPRAVNPKVVATGAGVAIAAAEWDAIGAAVIRAAVVVPQDSIKPRPRVRLPTSPRARPRATNPITRQLLSVEHCG